ncbi:hypothetical protein [Bosea sp. ANAM02]|uniref:hypothetical protein n=1 Tax=Bosea sp. ANAM02 TaxID=2020412 RepID=UPI00140EA7AC|nr:hypothetical protein [Bosea sp. ANAM02]BCB18316.1 hypothetical protein OCUBac02_12100 [Bosea sp. ANAM02]
MRLSIQTAFVQSAIVGIALACLGSSPSQAQAPAAPQQKELAATVTSYWTTTKTGALRDKKIYGRFALHKDAGRLLNQMNFICPKNRRTYAHLTIYLDDMIALGVPYKPAHGKIEGQFAIDGNGAITLAGESIDTELFFDRTPANVNEIDRVLNAKRIQLRVGETQIAYDTNPKFEELMRELLAESAGATGFFSTEAMLADCRKYRGESAR